MFYIMESEFYLNSKQICKSLMSSGSVEEEVSLCRRWEVQICAMTVIFSKPWNVVNFCKFTAYSSGVNIQNFTAFHSKVMYEICVEKPTFHCLSYIFCRFFFLDPGRFCKWIQNLQKSCKMYALSCKMAGKVIASFNFLIIRDDTCSETECVCVCVCVCVWGGGGLRCVLQNIRARVKVSPLFIAKLFEISDECSEITWIRRWM